jgi:cytochrome c oxidase subunit 4
MTADAHVEEHFAGTNKLFISIWVWLVVLTLVEIFLAYKPMSIFLMLVVLIVAYFMHLKFERLSLILTLIPALVVCILLLSVFFPDSFRSAGLRYKFQEQPPVAPAPLEEP